LKIKLYWPRCKFLNKQWVDEEIDSYWVECTLKEAEKYVFSYLSTDQIEESRSRWKPREKGSKDEQIEKDYLYYLVSKDLQSIISFPWYYPYSGQWNAYCPFEEIKEVEIKELKDVSRVIVDKNWRSKMSNKSYSKQEIIDNIKKSINSNVKNLYKEKFVNYRGKTNDTKEYYTEVIAQELIQNNIFELMSSIQEVVRNSGHKVASHDGITLKITPRKEEIFCKELFSLSKYETMKKFDEIGEILDYQVPLKNKRSDTGVGKIDLISKTENTIWLLELKIETNKESVLRCILEIATYYQLLSNSKFLESYDPEFPSQSIIDIKKGILVAKGSSQENELDEMNCGKRNNLKNLMKILKVEAFTIDADYNVVRK